MLFFRAPAHDMPASGPLEALDVANIIDDAMRPGHFFVAANCRFNWIAARSETVAWEIFRGRLVDAIQTREKRTFLAWHVIEESGECAPTESTISVKFDVNARQIHVTRGLLAHVWEGYDAGGGVIESRETKRWTRELVGAIALSDFAEAASLRDELICLIWQALVGTSRLPLTSIEAPLPAFTFGQMHYVYRGDAGESPVASWQDLLSFASRPELARHEIVKLLEFTLRHIEASDLPAFADMAQAILPTNEIAGAWRAMFNAVSLSPYTQFVDHALGAF
ncbi:MAG: hypothetical protein HYR84_00465, partial [Planctomycetes bacterium]|nr:hypothetical protein [Planctomycetota bacterium]